MNDEIVHQYNCLGNWFDLIKKCFEMISQVQGFIPNEKGMSDFMPCLAY